MSIHAATTSQTGSPELRRDTTLSSTLDARDKARPAWLEDAVFYQIYPQSFRDSNGDGIGDLQGIIDKLPYLRSLGITAVWLNPCYESPFGDAGYDVADFYKVAPRYGTNEDLERLFAEAKRQGIRIMLDLVAGHTSNQHPWFRESQKHAKNQYSDWYIWTDSVWTWFAPGIQIVVGGAERDANYVPNFFHFQPALNYGYAKLDPKCPWQQPVDAPGPKAVREELKRIMKFWFDKGADGFRVDMAGSLVKNDPDGSATAALWKEFRAWMDREYPDKAMVSEWSQPQVAVPQGFHMDFLLPFAKPGYKALFRADASGTAAIFDRDNRGDMRVFMDEFKPLLEATKGKGFIAIPSGNHDTVPRLGRGRSAAEQKVALAFLLTMPGVPFIYYGDELGMVDPEGLPSKEGGYGRTGARTPMQWADDPGAGFSTAAAAAFYLPVDPSPSRPNVAAQEKDRDSVLTATRRLITLRREHPALCASGDFRDLCRADGKAPFAYERGAVHVPGGKASGERILILLNPTGKAAELDLPADLRIEAMDTLEGARGCLQKHPSGWLATVPAQSFSLIRISKTPE